MVACRWCLKRSCYTCSHANDTQRPGVGCAGWRPGGTGEQRCGFSSRIVSGKRSIAIAGGGKALPAGTTGSVAGGGGCGGIAQLRGTQPGPRDGRLQPGIAGGATQAAAGRAEMLCAVQREIPVGGRCRGPGDAAEEQDEHYRPDHYVELVGSALFFPLTWTNGTEQQRLENVVELMSQVPRLYTQAKANLRGTDAVFIDTAVDENAGNRDVITSVGERIPAGSP